MTIKGFSSADYTTAKGIRWEQGEKMRYLLWGRLSERSAEAAQPAFIRSPRNARDRGRSRSPRRRNQSNSDLLAHAASWRQYIIPVSAFPMSGSDGADRALALLGGGYHHEKEASGAIFTIGPTSAWDSSNATVKYPRCGLPPSESDAGTIRYATAMN